MNEMDREKLLQYITEVGFAMFDSGLYLNTHPDDQEALAYYHKYRIMKEEAVKEYESYFGPLSSDSVNSDCKWTWICDKWPWEGGC